MQEMEAELKNADLSAERVSKVIRCIHLAFRLHTRVKCLSRICFKCWNKCPRLKSLWESRVQRVDRCPHKRVAWGKIEAGKHGCVTHIDTRRHTATATPAPQRGHRVCSLFVCVHVVLSMWIRPVWVWLCRCVRWWVSSLLYVAHRCVRSEYECRLNCSWSYILCFLKLTFEFRCYKFSFHVWVMSVA